MARWAFDDMGLQFALQNYMARRIKADPTNRAAVTISAAIVADFLGSPEAGVIRIDEVRAAARELAQQIRQTG